MDNDWKETLEIIGSADKKFEKYFSGICDETEQVKYKQTYTSLYSRMMEYVKMCKCISVNAVMGMYRMIYLLLAILNHYKPI